jgi:ubiquinone biosynthesis protein
LRGPHNIWRLIRTGATLERTGAMKQVLQALQAPPHLRLAARILGWPFAWLGLKGDPLLPPVTRALTALGPAYIKFGQIMSTRPDVVGDDLAMQLRVLQDKLPSFPRSVALRVVRDELGQPIDDLFSEFSEPIAAASIAQVHRARLAGTGEEVAVKVLRPGIERAFQKDVDAFYLAAWIIETLSPSSRRLRPRDVIAHFEGVVLGELDLRLETSSADEFAAKTAKDDGFRVPKVYWLMSGRRVMTLAWANGIPSGDVAAIEAAGHDRNDLGERVLRLFLRHALRDGLFHADMHQGNLKIGTDGAIVALDFGIMGRIDEYTRRAYAEILFGFIRKDYRRVAEVHFEAGYVPPDRDIDEFASALRSVGEPIFGMETRTELILLQRTMVVVEGVSRSLNPQINIWRVAQPVVEDYIRENIGPRALAGDLAKTARVLARFGPRLPQLAEAALLQQTRAEIPPSRRFPWQPVAWFLAGLGTGATALLLALG